MARRFNRRRFLKCLAAVPVAGLLPALGRCSPALGDALGRIVSGPVSVRGDAAYEARRSDIWSALVPERYPQAIVTALSIGDVQAAVRYAASHGLKVAIRGGGHNWSAASLRQDSLLIDLGQMRDMRIDAKARRAYVSPGCSGGALLQAALDEGLAFPVAHCPSVPLSGYLLNGGFGFNSNSWGSAAAHVLAMDIVLADGELVRASPEENAALYWAARGAGPGFFGIVVGFELNLLQNPGSILATTYVFPLAMAAELAAWAQERAAEAPVSVEYTYLVAASGGNPAQPGLCVVGGIAFTGDDAASQQDLAFLADCPFAEKALVAERAVRTSWESLLESVAALFPPRLHYLGNTIWTQAPITGMYPGFARMLQEPSSPYNFSNCVFYPVGRPDAPVLPDAAVSMQQQILCLYYAIWDDPAATAANRQWFQAANALFEAHAGGHYIGETDLNLYPAYGPGCYGAGEWARLAQLRQVWDPQGRFFNFLGQEQPA